MVFDLCADGDDGHGCWADEAAEAESDACAEKAVDVFKKGDERERDGHSDDTDANEEEIGGIELKLQNLSERQ